MHVLMFLLTVSAPPFVVENKCPPRFEVVDRTTNKCPCPGGCACTTPSGSWYYVCPKKVGMDCWDCDGGCKSGGPNLGKIDCPCTKAGKCLCTHGCPKHCPAGAAVRVKVLSQSIDGVPLFGYGSGTVIACEDGKSLVLTCRHVVPNCNWPVVVVADGKEYPVIHVDVAPGFTGENDLCLLTITGDLPVIPLATKLVKPGDLVIQYGFSGGKMAAKEGKVLDRSLFPGRTMTTLPCEFGDSGSGLFCHGKLVGVTWGKCDVNRRVDPRTGTIVDRPIENECKHNAVKLETVYAFLGDNCFEFPKFKTALMKSDFMKKIKASGVKLTPPLPARAPAVPGCPDGRCLPGQNPFMTPGKR